MSERSTSTTGIVLVSVLVTLAVLALLGGVFIYAGAYNVAATDNHGGLMRWIFETTQERSVRAHAADVRVDVPGDSAAVQRGFVAFDEMCVVCHGAPGVDRGWMGRGMTPRPPALEEEAREFSPAELYWILSNGIKLAGMPALSPTHSEEEILDIVAFLQHLPSMSDEEYQAWRERQAGDEGASEAPAGHAGHDHTH